MIKTSVKLFIFMVLCGNHLKRVKYIVLAFGRVYDVAVVYIDNQRTNTKFLSYNILIEYKEQQIYQVAY